MKKNEMRKLALLGMTAGLISMTPSGLQADLDTNVVDMDYVIAKSKKCKSSDGGCGGFTSGLQSKASSFVDANVIDLDYVMARPSCKAHGGCNGLTASRDPKAAPSDEEMEDEEDHDHDEIEEDGEDQPA